METRTFTQQINAKDSFMNWVISCYVIRKMNIVIYALYKLLGLFFFFDNIYYISYSYLYIILVFLSILIFFYSDIRMVRIYFKMKKNIRNLYGTELDQVYTFTEDYISVKDKFRETITMWKDITKVKQTKCCFLFYKKKLILQGFVKRSMSQDEVDLVINYLQEKYEILNHVKADSI